MTVKWPSNEVPANAYRVGARAVPATDDELRDLLGELFERDLAEGDFSMDAQARDRLTARFATHPVIDVVEADFTGVTARVDEPAGSVEPKPEGPKPEDPRPEIATRVEAALRLGTVVAHPLHIETMPITIDLATKKLALDWLTDTEGTLWLSAGERKLEGFEATGELAFNLDDANAALREIAERAAKHSDVPVRVREISVDLEAEKVTSRATEQPFTLTVVADGRYLIFGARVTVTLTGVLHTDTATVTLHDAKFRSTNPLVQVAFFTFRKRLREYLHQPLELVKGLPDGYRVEHVEVRTRGRDVTATFRIV